MKDFFLAAFYLVVFALFAVVLIGSPIYKAYRKNTWEKIDGEPERREAVVWITKSKNTYNKERIDIVVEIKGDVPFEAGKVDTLAGRVYPTTDKTPSVENSTQKESDGP